ncbi:hypothetical protein [Marinicellulosiphila megalodicopiae]|uniref:hypothetical protein n=1 Tax=Marinicellulosiphila megalodicopiae TaxID=2724896 RepID=UPI003BB20767
MEFRIATLSEIDEVLTLHQKYQIDSINENDKSDGFITTAFTKAHLVELIQIEQGLFVAINDDVIVAYAMSASWNYWSKWPMFEYMIKKLPELSYEGIELNINNSYQYGPVCVDKSIRNSGVFEALFEFALTEMSKRYPVLVTFVNKINTRSFAAHTRKVKLDVIQEFEFNNNYYYELACKTER